MTQIISQPERSEEIIKEGKASDRLQIFFDDIQQRLNDSLLGFAVRIPIYAKATLPSASENFLADGFSSIIYVKDDAGGAIPAFTDGTNWRHFDRTIVS